MKINNIIYLEKDASGSQLVSIGWTGDITEKERKASKKLTEQILKLIKKYEN